MITAVNGKPVKDARDLARQIGSLAPGASVKLTVWRKGEEKTFTLTLGELPNQREARATPDDSEPNGTDVPRLGLTLAPAGEVAGSGSDGVVVTNVDPNGVAAEHGFKTGDVILEVGGKKVGSPADIRNALGDAQKEGKRTVADAGEVGRCDEVRRAAARPSLTEWGVPLASVAPAGGSNQGDGQSCPSPPLASAWHPVAPAGTELVEGRWGQTRRPSFIFLGKPAIGGPAVEPDTF